MEEKKRSRTYRREQNIWRTQPLVWNFFFLLVPAMQLFAVQAITLAGGAQSLLWGVQHFGAVLLNYFFLLLLLILLLSLTGSLLCASLIPTLPLLLLSLANYFKQAMNGVPLVASDLSMLGRLGDLASFLRPGAQLSWGGIGAILILLVFFALLAIFAVKPRVWKRPWYVRIAAIAICALFLLALHYLIPVREYLVGGEDEVQAERNERVGLLLGSYGALLAMESGEPEVYSENGMNLLLRELRESALETKAPAVQPNVILLMSESFCDPETVLPNAVFHEDPIPNYRALRQEFPAGTFLSNTYAGGTGNVELEVLTGVPNVFTGEGYDLTSLPDRATYERMPSIVKAFSGAGYATEFVHSYTDRLYNRAETLPSIGFERVLFEHDFSASAERAGPYISDMALTQKMIEEFEWRNKAKPLFLFGLSMQNHQPYYEGKFEAPSGLNYAAADLNQTELGALDALVRGVHDADAALAALIAYFEEAEEPVMIVFWGDHLPSLYLDEGSALYSRLGYAESTDTLGWGPDQMKRMHSTPFLVWNNYDAKLPVSEVQSALGLGNAVLTWAGVPKPLYFNLIEETMQEFLLYRERLFISADGTASAQPPLEAQEAVEKLKNVVYDMLFGKGYIATALTRVPDA